MAHISRRTLLRRGVLLGAVTGGAVLGVTKAVHHEVAVPPPGPPKALTAALAMQRRLLAGYDATLAADPARATQLTPLRSDVAAHGEALLAVLDRYPGWRLSQRTSRPTPSGSAPPAQGDQSAETPIAPTTAALAAASVAASTAAQGVAVQWSAAETNARTVVPLLGSISACLSTHAMVLS